MGEAGRHALRVGFDRAIKLEFHGARVSSDAGLFSYRDLDEAAGLTESAAIELFDFRIGTNIRHCMTALLRQSIYSRLAGYEDVNDAERLSIDPVMRHIVGGRAADHSAASTSEVGRFETDTLAQPGNLEALMNLPGHWVDCIRHRRPIEKLILDMDSSVSETYGQQEGTAYNGHFGCDCYHPLFVFNQDGDVESAKLRPGNVASADDWRSVLEPAIERYRDFDIRRFFRGDAAFAIPELYELLEAEGYRYAIRLKANRILERHISHLLTRPVGRPPKKPHRFYHSFDYQAQSWDRPRRVVAKVEWHQGELFPRVGFVVTNINGIASKVVNFYNQRGAAAEREALDADDASGQADQDRREGGSPCTVHHVPTGGGGGPPSAIPDDSQPDTPLRRDYTEGCADMTGRTDRQPDQRMWVGAIGAGMPTEKHRRSGRRERQPAREGPIPPWGTNSRLGKTGQASTIVHSDARQRSRAEVNWEMSTREYLFGGDW